MQVLKSSDANRDAIAAAVQGVLAGADVTLADVVTALKAAFPGIEAGAVHQGLIDAGQTDIDAPALHALLYSDVELLQLAGLDKAGQRDKDSYIARLNELRA